MFCSSAAGRRADVSHAVDVYTRAPDDRDRGSMPHGAGDTGACREKCMRMDGHKRLAAQGKTEAVLTVGSWQLQQAGMGLGAAAGEARRSESIQMAQWPRQLPELWRVERAWPSWAMACDAGKLACGLWRGCSFPVQWSAWEARGPDARRGSGPRVGCSCELPRGWGAGGWVPATAPRT